MEVVDKVRYSSTSGMSVKLWGSSFWKSLFTMILGSYPVKIDENNKIDIKTKKAFVSLFNNLRWTLPCIFCRLSYCGFYRKIPIEKYTGSRIKMMYWLYLIKDQVNKKLLKQEKEKRDEWRKLYGEGKITKKEFNDFFKNQFRTVKSPSFKKVLDTYEKLRAKCKT